MWHRLVWWKFTDISEESTASIFRSKRKPSNQQKTHAAIVTLLLFDPEDGISAFL
jgi:hypothetical protein